QARRDLTEPPPDTAEGVRIVVRGNGQRYFIHLRSSGTVLPWQYYQAGIVFTKWQPKNVILQVTYFVGVKLRKVCHKMSLYQKRCAS
ncbi:MAG: hypothetical protein SFU21_08705, partial [Flavihumibacter sp.]|nr:hypothetical protein [Flavihumibacter sp.]